MLTEGCDDTLEVLDHHILTIQAIASPVRVTVSTCIEGDRVIPGRPQRLACALPGMTRLATAMLKQHQRVIGVWPRRRLRYACRYFPAIGALTWECMEASCQRSWCNSYVSLWLTILVREFKFEVQLFN